MSNLQDQVPFTLGMGRKKPNAELLKYFRCFKCKYKCKNYTQLSRHELLHLNDEVFQCLSCDHIAESMYNLKEHVKVHQNLSDSSKKFICPLCDHWSSREANLRIHMRVHISSEERQKNLIKCSHLNCSFQTIFQSGLTAHLKTHSEEKPFQCNKCESAFKWPGNLKTHMLVHAGKSEREEVTRACPHKNCEYKTLYPGDLKKHIERHLYNMKSPQLGIHPSNKLPPRKVRAATRVRKNFKCTTKQTGNEIRELLIPKAEEETCDDISTPVIKSEVTDDFQLETKSEIKSEEPSTETTENVNSLKTPCNQLEALRTPGKTSNGLKRLSQLLRLEHECNKCHFRSTDEKLLALHNENVHGVPYVVLTLVN